MDHSVETADRHYRLINKHAEVMKGAQISDGLLFGDDGCDVFNLEKEGGLSKIVVSLQKPI